MKCEVGVIGNGTVGKAAALGFAQAGFRVVLLCPSESSISPQKMSPEMDARVFALNHTAKNLLTKLKVWNALDLQRAAPIEAMKVFDDKGGILLLDAYTAHQNELAWVVEDQNINQALDSALRFAPDITMVTGKAVTMSVDFSELTLDHGLSLRADLWVGADGAHSWLRNQADIGFDYRSYGQRGVVANFYCTKPHHGVAYQWFLGEQGIVALLPLPGQQVSLVWSAPDALADTLCREGTQHLVQRVMHYCVEMLGELVPLPKQRLQSFQLSFIKPHSIIGPQVALVGDAAHVVHPLAGHGLNLGFGDVTSLLETVAQRESWRNCGDARVLQRYARARKEDVLLMQLATDGLARLFASRFAPLKIVRHVGMDLVNKLPFLKKELIKQAIGH